jgi:hypothetical protein
MKTKILFLSGIKIFLAILVVVALLSPLPGNLITVDSKNLDKLSDGDLYAKAFGFMQKKDSLWAVMYLWAYVQRDPPAYVLNIKGHKTYIDGLITSLMLDINKPQQNINLVNANLRSCKCYPCNVCVNPNMIGVSSFQLSSNILDLQAPPDMVAVCQDFNFGGNCKFLTIGIYNNPDQIGLPNDSISSVMIGSNVKLILYLHGGLTGESITIVEDISDLSGYWGSQNAWNWNDNTTSLSVQNK